MRAPCRGFAWPRCRAMRSPSTSSGACTRPALGSDAILRWYRRAADQGLPEARTRLFEYEVDAATTKAAEAKRLEQRLAHIKAVFRNQFP